MRRRIHDDESDAIGTDSFLDVVANLVGILIILIMVIGVRAQDAWHAAVTKASRPESNNVATAAVAARLGQDVGDTAPATAEPDDAAAAAKSLAAEVAAAAAEAEQARGNLDRLKTTIHEIDFESAQIDQQLSVQRLERDDLLLAMSRAERELQQRREELDTNDQERVAALTQLHQSEATYADIIDQIESLKLSEVKTGVIQHVATPLAQTVFAREEHFRLIGGRLAYVPINELTAQLKSEAPKKLWKLEQADKVTESIGPLDDFFLKYTLQRTRYVVDSPTGPMAREAVELERFVMIPTEGQIGESVATALQPGSDLQRRLQGWDANETIVTIWTYPDSFSEFRQLKEQLLKQGFLTAARPLPDGQPISGSPSGSRSAAQ